VSSTHPPQLTLPDKVPQGLELGDILYHCLRQNFHADESNAAIHTAPARYSPLTFRIAEYLWNHFPSMRGKIEVAAPIADMGSYVEDAGR